MTFKLAVLNQKLVYKGTQEESLDEFMMMKSDMMFTRLSFDRRGGGIKQPVSEVKPAEKAA